jgi:hypothetical protein
MSGFSLYEVLGRRGAADVVVNAPLPVPIPRAPNFRDEGFLDCFSPQRGKLCFFSGNPLKQTRVAGYVYYYINGAFLSPGKLTLQRARYGYSLVFQLPHSIFLGMMRFLPL